MNKYRLFACCKPVGGFYRSMICDFQRNVFYFISNEFFRFIHQRIKKGISADELPAVKSKYDEIDLLFSLEMFYEVSDTETRSFPAISTHFDYYGHISNLIITVSPSNIDELMAAGMFFALPGCHNVEVVVLMPTDERVAEFIFRLAGNAELDLVKVLLPGKNGWLNFPGLDQGKLLGNVVIEYSDDQRIFSPGDEYMADCGCISPEYFALNLVHYNESQHHNTCLNRKLCIDQDGYIKNCPYMNHHYGHISHTDIAEVVTLPEFQQWWHIRKDEIDVCRDCEFRHLCTDCRALIKDPGNLYSQPSKCTYNPYICKWAGEEGYVPVEECGTYSRENGFVPDKGKIKRLNKEIWGMG